MYRKFKKKYKTRIKKLLIIKYRNRKIRERKEKIQFFLKCQKKGIKKTSKKTGKKLKEKRMNRNK